MNPIIEELSKTNISQETIEKIMSLGQLVKVKNQIGAAQSNLYESVFGRERWFCLSFPSVLNPVQRVLHGIFALLLQQLVLLDDIYF